MFKESVLRGIAYGSALKKLRRDLKLTKLSKKFRKLKTELEFMDSDFFDIVIYGEPVKNMVMFEELVNGYVSFQYASNDILAKTPIYSFGEAKQIFVQLHEDTETARIV